jgi:hypothetical protein
MTKQHIIFNMQTEAKIIIIVLIREISVTELGRRKSGNFGFFFCKRTHQNSECAFQ